MTDRTERAVLNHVIETCKDAERGFRHIAEHATDPALKSLFLDIASERARFAADLLPHAHRLGGAHSHDGTTAHCIAPGSTFAAPYHAEIPWRRSMRPSEASTSRAASTMTRSRGCFRRRRG